MFKNSGHRQTQICMLMQLSEPAQTAASMYAGPHS